MTCVSDPGRGLSRTGWAAETGPRQQHDNDNNSNGPTQYIIGLEYSEEFLLIAVCKISKFMIFIKISNKNLKKKKKDIELLPFSITFSVHPPLKCNSFV